MISLELVGVRLFGFMFRDFHLVNISAKFAQDGKWTCPPGLCFVATNFFGTNQPNFASHLKFPCLTATGLEVVSLLTVDFVHFLTDCMVDHLLTREEFLGLLTFPEGGIWDTWQIPVATEGNLMW